MSIKFKKGKPPICVDEWHVSDWRCNVYLCWQRISELMPANKPLFITRPQLVSPAYLRAVLRTVSKTQDAPGEDSKDNLQSQIHPESRWSPSESLLNLDTPPDFSFTPPQPEIDLHFLPSTQFPWALLKWQVPYLYIYICPKSLYLLIFDKINIYERIFSANRSKTVQSVSKSIECLVWDVSIVYACAPVWTEVMRQVWRCAAWSLVTLVTWTRGLSPMSLIRGHAHSSGR